MTALKRRARPLLGTLVEVTAASDAAIDAAFAAVAGVQSRMSRFDPGSDIGRFNALPAGAAIEVDAGTASVLQAAGRLHADSGGLFDVTLGSAGPGPGWRLDDGRRLLKLEAGVALDLGGIAKGHAVDCAVAALRAAGTQAGCVNAGGDLRAFGGLEVPVLLRDEHAGGVRPFCLLADGALATSCYAGGARSSLAGAAPVATQVSVAAETCLWADALTKLVAATGRTDHPLLARHGALAWRH